MKMLPVQLSLNPPLGLWSDVLWRCPPAPPSQLAELKTQLPASLPSDPRLWCREDVSVFLRFCEREFDLPKVDYDLFQMNGKALCLLTRADFGHRCPGAGDVLHNVLQMLIIESHMMQWHLPNSPVTPTSRYPLSPHSHPPTPTWPPIAPSESQFHNANATTTTPHNMHHFMAPNSVTLSPPPSVDSQASSPPQNNQEQQQQQQQHNGCTNSISSSTSNNSSNGSNSCNGSTVSVLNSSNSNSSSGSGSINSNTNGNCHAFALGSAHNLSTMKSTNNSDSEEENAYAADTTAAVSQNLAARAAAAAAAVAQYNASPPTTPILKDMPQLLSQQLQNSFVNSWSQSQQSLHQQQQQQQQHQQQQQQQLQQQQQKGQHSQHERKSPQLGSGSVSAPTTPSFMQPVKREFFPDNYKLPVKREFFPDSPEPNTNGRLLWDFLQQLLNDREQKYSDLIAWKCRDTGVFKIVDPAGLAKLWGIQKNHLSMNYDKMSRALRYYYRVNILRKVQGERHCYQFLRNPSELKNIKNISLLRQSLGNQQTTANNQQTSNNTNNNNNNNNNNSNTNGNSTTANQQQQTQSQQQQQSNNNTNNSNSNNNNNNSYNECSIYTTTNL